MEKKDITINVNLIIVIIAMFAFFGAYFAKALFFVFAPGFALMLLFFRKHDLEKIILLSFPLSLTFFLLPYFAFSKVDIAIPYWFFYIIPIISLIYILLNIKLKLNLSVKLDMAVPLVIFFLISSYVFQAYNQNEGIPLTGGTRAVVTPLFTMNNIKENGKVPFWFSNWYSGAHFYQSYSPFTYFTTAVLGLIESEQFYKNVNLTYIFCIIFFTYGCYVLFKRLGLSKSTAIFSCIICVITPFLSGDMAFKGNLVSSFMLAFFPGMIYFLLESFNEKSIKTVILYSTNLLAFVLSYYFDLYFCIFVFAAVIIVYLIKSKSKKLVLRNTALFFFVPVLLSATWSIPFIIHNDEFPLEYREGGWNIPLSDLNAFLDLISHPINTNELGSEQSLVTFSPIIFYLGLISFVFVFLLKINRNRLLLSNLILFVLLAIMTVEIIPGHTIIPLREKFYGHYRSWHLMIPFFAFNIGLFAEFIKCVSKRHLKTIATFVPLALLIIMAPVIEYSKTINSNSLKETAVIDESGFKEIYNSLSNSPEGRVIDYGIFGPAILWAIPKWTDLDMFAGYGFERHCIKTVYTNNILKLQEASNDLLLASATKNLAYNMYLQTYTTKILFNVCHPSGFNAFNRTVLQDLSRYGALYQSTDQCFVIATTINQSSYSEVPVLTGIFASNRDEIISKILNMENGFLYTFALNDTLDKEDYDVIITDSSEIAESYSEKSVLFNENTDLESELNKLNLKPVLLDRNRTKEDVIKTTAINDWILVKEAYMTKWNAYQNGNNLDIVPSYLGYMLIKSESNSEITIKFEPDIDDYIGTVISFAMIVFIILIFSNIFNFIKR